MSTFTAPTAERLAHDLFVTFRRQNESLEDKQFKLTLKEAIVVNGSYHIPANTTLIINKPENN